MLAPRQLDECFAKWNWRWRAPFGSPKAKRFIPKRYWYTRTGLSLIGMFGLQPNSTTRKFEYPWAFHVVDIRPGMTVIDIGAGFSGFPFVLARHGALVTNVDPFVDYGPEHKYPASPLEMYSRMNVAYGTSVVLEPNTIDKAGIASASVDVVYCISALEHMPPAAVADICREVGRILKYGGHFVLTVDMFLDLYPFTDLKANQYGTNISVKQAVELSGLTLILGDLSELVGFPQFEPRRVLAQVDRYLIGESHPVLTQALVLQRPAKHAATR